MDGQAGTPCQVPSLRPCKATPKLVNNSHTQEPFGGPQRAKASKQVDCSQNHWTHGAGGSPWLVSLISIYTMPAMCPAWCCERTQYSAYLNELRAITTCPFPFEKSRPMLANVTCLESPSSSMLSVVRYDLGQILPGLLGLQECYCVDT